MRLIRLPCTALLALACAASFAPLTVASTERPAIDGVVQEAAQTLMQQYNIPGLAIGLSVDGQQRFYNFGVASRDTQRKVCLLYTSPSPRDRQKSRMPSSA